jgi:hypothetical protein
MLVPSLQNCDLNLRYFVITKYRKQRHSSEIALITSTNILLAKARYIANPDINGIG